MTRALAALLLSASHEGGGGSGLTDINFGLTLWTIVLFALFAFVLTKLGWRPLLNVIEEREKSVRDAVEGAQKASAEAQALLTKHHEMLREAAREREEIIKKALQESEQIKADLTARAKAASDQMLQRAREQLDREKAQAVLELRAEVADLAIEAASKIVESSLTPDAQRKLVDEFIATLPKVG
jgi:F-type H+-transporting ATPase subunit b